MDSRIKTAFDRARRRDRVAAAVIVVGGIAIIFTVVAMLVLIVSVAMPLFSTPTAHRIEEMPSTVSPGARPVAAGVDDYFELGYVIDSRGTLRILNLRQKTTRDTIPLREGLNGLSIVNAERWGGENVTLLWSDGVSTAHSIRLRVRFDEEGNRSLEADVTELPAFEPVVSGAAPVASAIRATGDGLVTYVEMTADHRISVSQQKETEDFLGNVTREDETFALDVEPLGGTPSVFAVSEDGSRLYVGTETGQIGHWSLQSIGDPKLETVVREGHEAVTALDFVFGDVTLAVGTEQGGLSGWFPVATGENGKRLTRIKHLPPMPAAIQSIQPTRRNKVVFARDTAGSIAAYHMTSERRLLTLPSTTGVRVLGMSDKGDGLATLDEAGNMTLWALDMAHPESSWKTLFGKIWYENYNSPEYIWQSSAPSDDYEPKLSLVPLIFGTFKGAIYALFCAVPLSLLGAIYTSQFARPELRAVIKPVVEIMASVPSVVIGFLIALWLAPIVDDFLLAFFLVLFMIPLTFVIFIVLYSLLDGTAIARRIARGYEFIAVAPVLLLACILSWLIAIPLEHLLFDGNLQLWLYENLGERYDQRNAIIISVGLGFAAIPIIFTMAEDALSNLPTSLRAASLALGASRWQTVWRVVFPSASPGIFAAMIIGFGRVIGETMIVLMATGNTPILDWSPFNGMRTLSANIAVEIPEAPVGGTLYRILFLSAVVLFILTFVLNTAAEVIRQRLRRKYARY